MADAEEHVNIAEAEHVAPAIKSTQDEDGHNHVANDVSSHPANAGAPLLAKDSVIDDTPLVDLSASTTGVDGEHSDPSITSTQELPVSEVSHLKQEVDPAPAPSDFAPNASDAALEELIPDDSHENETTGELAGSIPTPSASSALVDVNTEEPDPSHEVSSEEIPDTLQDVTEPAAAAPAPPVDDQHVQPDLFEFHAHVSTEDTAPDPPVEEASKPFEEAVHAEEAQAAAAEPDVVVELEETPSLVPEVPAAAAVPHEASESDVPATSAVEEPTTEPEAQEVLHAEAQPENAAPVAESQPTTATSDEVSDSKPETELTASLGTESASEPHDDHAAPTAEASAEDEAPVEAESHRPPTVSTANSAVPGTTPEPTSEVLILSEPSSTHNLLDESKVELADGPEDVPIPAPTSVVVDGPEIAALAALQVDTPAILKSNPLLPTESDVPSSLGADYGAAGAEDDSLVPEPTVESEPAAEAEYLTTSGEPKSFMGAFTPAHELSNPFLASAPSLAPAASESTALEPASEWASTAPTPIEEEVVLAPVDSTAAETIATIDAMKSGGDPADGLLQDNGESRPDEEATRAALANSDAILKDINKDEQVQEALGHYQLTPGREEESTVVPQQTHSTAESVPEGDVHDVLATLDDVPTPAVDLDMETPGLDEPLDEQPSLLATEDIQAPLTPTIEVSDEDGVKVFDHTAEDIPEANEISEEVAEEQEEVQPPAEAKENVVEEEEEQRPNRPWTPSYSVSSQGPGTPGKEAEDDDDDASTVDDEDQDAPHLQLKRSPSSASNNNVLVPEVEKIPSRPWTPSYSVTNQGTVGQDEHPIDEVGAIAATAALVSLPAEGTTSEDTALPQESTSLVPEVIDEEEEPTEPAAATSAEPEQGITSEDTAPATNVVDEDEPAILESSIAPPVQHDEPSAEAADVEDEDNVAPVTGIHAEDEAAAPVHKETVADDDVAPVTSEDTAPASDALDLVDDEGVQDSTTAPPEPAHVVPTLVVDGEAQDTTEEPTEAQPRSASRPWTPSYSVTNQGSASPGKEKEPEPAQADEEEDFVPPVPLPSLKRSMSSSSIHAPLTPTDGQTDRPPSRPWTPSYSVTDQRPGQPEASITEGSQTTEPEAISEHVAETLATPAERERPPSRPWTPSYSTTSQGPGQADSEAVVDTELVEPIANAEPEVSAGPEPVLAAEDDEVKDPAIPTAASGSDENEELAAPETTLTAPADGERPPSRPWTPSYSTTSQGPGQVDPAPAVPEVVEDEVPEAAASTLSTQDQGERPPSRPWTPSYSTTSQGPGQVADEPVHPDSEEPKEPEAPVTTAPALAAQEPVERPPSRPWTPSYSTTSQGPTQGMTEVAEPEVTETEAEASEAEAEAPALSAQEQADRPPSRPWTPSYSTTSQGPGQVVEAEAASQDEEPAETTAKPSLVTTAVVERPPSRPWTPSYSTTSQGPNEPQAEIEPDITDQVPEKLDTPAVADGERPPSRPWTPSYSVTKQEPGTAQDEDQPAVDEDAPSASSGVDLVAPIPVMAAPRTPELRVNDIPEVAPVEKNEEPERSKSPWTPSYSVTDQPGSPRTKAAELPTSKDNEADEQPERPKSPWTPSYSVTDQPGSPRTHAAELSASKDVEADKQKSRSPSPAPDQQDRPPSRPWTPSYSVTNLKGVSDAAVEDKVEEPLIALGSDDQATSSVAETKPNAGDVSPAKEGVPPRPWTPSYSVHSQGPATPQEENKPAEADKRTISPVKSLLKEFPSEQPGTKDPELTPLAAVSDNADDASTRTRLSSISSGRFFPGGWFSSTPTVKESFDEAELPDDAHAEDVGVATTAGAGEEEAKESKRRCVIM